MADNWVNGTYHVSSIVYDIENKELKKMRLQNEKSNNREKERFQESLKGKRRKKRIYVVKYYN